MKTLFVRLPDEVHQQIKESAKALGVSMSDLTKILILQYLAKQKPSLEITPEFLAWARKRK